MHVCMHAGGLRPQTPRPPMSVHVYACLCMSMYAYACLCMPGTVSESQTLEVSDSSILEEEKTRILEVWKSLRVSNSRSFGFFVSRRIEDSNSQGPEESLSPKDLKFWILCSSKTRIPRVAF